MIKTEINFCCQYFEFHITILFIKKTIIKRQINYANDYECVIQMVLLAVECRGCREKSLSLL